MTRREKNIGLVMMGIIVLWGLSNLLSVPLKGKPPVPVVLENSTPPPKQETVPPGPGKTGRIDIQSVIALAEQRFPNISPAEDPQPFLDPFQQLTLQLAPLDFSDLVLKGSVIWGAGEPMVLINDQILKEGDVVYGFKVE